MFLTLLVMIVLVVISLIVKAFVKANHMMNALIADTDKIVGRD